uniref:C-factor-like n=1 Tax=Varanus komodoensis TaxID=61221 RepID=A0A8D2IU44_VARKO
MDALKARSILVTGSNRGIGWELVKQLVEKNNRPEWIFATCRYPDGPRAQDLRNLAAKHQGLQIIPLGMSLPSSIQAAVARVSEHLNGAGLNLLINNAAIIKSGTVESTTPEDMTEVYKTNVIGPLLMSQAFLPLLRKAAKESPQGGMSCSKAAIVNISSTAGSIETVLVWHNGQIIAYRCSKAALNMLTRCQSLAFAQDNILCVALHPGWVQTDMGNTLGEPPVTAELSARGLLHTLARLSEKDSGTFVTWEGENVPW